MAFVRRAAIVAIVAPSLLSSAQATAATQHVRQWEHHGRVVQKIHKIRDHVWKMQREMLNCCRAYRHRAERSDSWAVRKRVLERWTRIRARVERNFRPWSDAWLSAMICVHSHEGAWTSVSATVPTYYGGVQADQSFEDTYGHRFYVHLGNANRWTAHQQLLMAYQGWLARGWTPWPLTARMCGLL